MARRIYLILVCMFSLTVFTGLVKAHNLAETSSSVLSYKNATPSFAKLTSASRPKKICSLKTKKRAKSASKAKKHRQVRRGKHKAAVSKKVTRATNKKAAKSTKKRIKKKNSAKKTTLKLDKRPGVNTATLSSFEVNYQKMMADPRTLQTLKKEADLFGGAEAANTLAPQLLDALPFVHALCVYGAKQTGPQQTMFQTLLSDVEGITNARQLIAALTRVRLGRFSNVALFINVIGIEKKLQNKLPQLTGDALLHQVFLKAAAAMGQ